MNENERDRATDILCRAAARGRLPKLLNQYLESCRSPTADPKKDPGQFPNLAGFCRWMGCGMAEADALRAAYPALYDRLCATLEDEALNSDLSPSVLTAYLKRRLGYADKPEDAPTAADCGNVRLIFEHDISEDGQ